MWWRNSMSSTCSMKKTVLSFQRKHGASEENLPLLPTFPCRAVHVTLQLCEALWTTLPTSLRTSQSSRSLPSPHSISSYQKFNFLIRTSNFPHSTVVLFRYSYHSLVWVSVPSWPIVAVAVYAVGYASNIVFSYIIYTTSRSNSSNICDFHGKNI